MFFHAEEPLDAGSAPAGASLPPPRSLGRGRHRGRSGPWAWGRESLGALVAPSARHGALHWRHDTTYRYLLALLLTVAMVFMLLPVGFDWHIEEKLSAEGASGGTIARKVQWLPIYVICAYVIFRRRALFLIYLRHINPFLPLFIAWCGLTAFWSYDPATTIRKTVQFAGLASVGIAFSLASWYPARVQTVLRPFFALMVAICIVSVIVAPDFAKHDALGDPALLGNWKGVTSNKNTFGMLCAMCFIFYSHGWASRAVSARQAVPILLMTMVGLYGAKSTTSMVISVASAGWIWMLLRNPIVTAGGILRLLLMAILILAVPLFIYLLIVGDLTWAKIATPIVTPLGKDITLTQRTVIWEEMTHFIVQHPWAGGGYGAFWLGHGSASDPISKVLFWIPWQGHNGYMDMLNETGIIGLTLCISLLVWHGVQLFRVKRHDIVTFSLHCTLWLHLLIVDVTEAEMFRVITVPFLMSMISSATVSRVLMAVELRQQTLAGTAPAGHGAPSLALATPAQPGFTLAPPAAASFVSPFAHPTS